MKQFSIFAAVFFLFVAVLWLIHITLHHSVHVLPLRLKGVIQQGVIMILGMAWMNVGRIEMYVLEAQEDET